MSAITTEEGMVGIIGGLEILKALTVAEFAAYAATIGMTFAELLLRVYSD